MADNAYDALVAQLRQWGLETLAPDVLKLLQQGNSQDQVMVLIQDTPSYRQRFSGNDVRRRNGLAVLSPAEYLSVEASYRRIMESAGLPAGFYDQPSDYAAFIGSDKSPQEISSRVQMAVDAANRLDAGTKQAFQDYYGVGRNDLAAFFLDGERAMPFLQRAARAADVGGRLSLDRVTAEQVATGTLVDQSQYGQAASTAAATAAELGAVAGFFGETYTTADAAKDVFLADQQAQAKKQKIVQRNVAEFTGSGGVGKSSLSVSGGF